MKINEDNRLCNLIAKCLAYGRRVGIVSDDDNIACLDLLMRKDTSWKPSEEQMKSLLQAEGILRRYGCREIAKDIAGLYNDLKKL